MGMTDKELEELINILFDYVFYDARPIKKTGDRKND